MKILNIVLFCLLGIINFRQVAFAEKNVKAEATRQTEKLSTAEEKNMKYGKSTDDVLISFAGKHVKVDVTYQTEVPNPQEEKNRKYGDIDDILKRGEIVICSINDTANPLFLMKKKGTGNNEELDLVGADIELAKKIAKALGVRLVFRLCYKSYEDVVDAIANGEGDIGLSKLSYTTKRSRKVMYTKPYVVAKMVLLINRQIVESSRDKSIKDLLNNENISIGVKKGASYEEFAKLLFPKAKIVGIKNWEKDVVKKLLSKEITATIRDNLRTNILINQNPSLSLNIVPIILKDEIDYIPGIVNYNALKLLNWINRFFEVEIGIRTIDELMTKYEDYVK